MEPENPFEQFSSVTAFCYFMFQLSWFGPFTEEEAPREGLTFLFFLIKKRRKKRRKKRKKKEDRLAHGF